METTQKGKTQVISVRLSHELVEILDRRVEAWNGGDRSEYLRWRLEYDLTRRHSRPRPARQKETRNNED